MAESRETAVVKDDLALVAEAKAGSYEAFEELVSRYENKIYRLGVNITGNSEDAEDVLQEAFLKAFQHLAEFREDSRFYTWLVRIAVNEALMKLRKIRSNRTVPLEDEIGEDGDPIPRELADWKPNPEQIFAQEEIESILRDAAQKLPASYRTVFLLRDMEDLSTAEAASVLGLTEGTVKARLFRARLMLREELSKVFKRG
jgi:RNA polymerase sigma-70 factor (ECF subfamily)